MCLPTWNSGLTKSSMQAQLKSKNSSPSAEGLAPCLFPLSLFSHLRALLGPSHIEFSQRYLAMLGCPELRSGVQSRGQL